MRAQLVAAVAETRNRLLQDGRFPFGLFRYSVISFLKISESFLYQTVEQDKHHERSKGIEIIC